ncbi:DUF4339 domain-containing protein [Geothrix fuzhouensis]|uniref:DUF4339 domain-containing protein n=1 Tax=Geothrix fuzhouensis TaxID=2966451 RepID=UPI00214728AF|nr:DUF4339 domain-containing protein [Geothrix fuzhouensis]
MTTFQSPMFGSSSIAGADNYYVRIRGQEYGPYSIDQLINMRDSNEIGPSTELRFESGSYFQAKDEALLFSTKSRTVAMALSGGSLLTGAGIILSGLDRLYLGHKTSGFIKLIFSLFSFIGLIVTSIDKKSDNTFFIFCMLAVVGWSVYDLIAIITKKMNDGDGLPLV